MVKFHCDYEGCTNAVEASPELQSHGGPPGWAVMVWSVNAKAPPSREARMMKIYATALRSIAPDNAHSALDSLGGLADENVNAFMACKAFICPTCIDRVALSGFNVVSRPGALGGLFPIG